MARFRRFHLALALALTLFMLVAVGCGKQATNPAPSESSAGSGTNSGTDSSSSASAPAPAPKPTIGIGSKNFTEQLILGEMYALLLENNGFQVERKLNLGGTLVAHEALLSGDIDLYPEYTGTALTVQLEQPVDTDPARVYQTVKTMYKEKFNAEFLEPTGFNNTYCLAVRQETAQKYSLKTLSDLAKVAGELTIDAPTEFDEREDGLPGLKKTYGLEFGKVQMVDVGLRYHSISNGKTDVAVCYGTDGEMAGFNLVRLEDDKQFWAPYPVAAVVRADTLAKAPEIAGILNQLSSLLDDSTMQALNWKSSGPDKLEPADVARTFLQEKGLIK